MDDFDFGEIITRFWPILRDKLETTEIIPHIQGLTRADVETIDATKRNEGAQRGVDKLVEAIKRRDRKCFISFILALEKCKHEELSQQIIREGGLHRYVDWDLERYRINHPNRKTPQIASVHPATSSGFNTPDFHLRRDSPLYICDASTSSTRVNTPGFHSRRDIPQYRSNASTSSTTYYSCDNYDSHELSAVPSSPREYASMPAKTQGESKASSPSDIPASNSRALQGTAKLTLDTKLNFVPDREFSKWATELNRGDAANLPWRILGQNLGLTRQEIKKLSKESNPGEELLDLLTERKEEFTVRDLIRLLSGSKELAPTLECVNRALEDESCESSTGQMPDSTPVPPENVTLGLSPTTNTVSSVQDSLRDRKSMPSSVSDNLLNNLGKRSPEKDLAYDNKSSSIGKDLNVPVSYSSKIGPSTSRNEENFQESSKISDEKGHKSQGYSAGETRSVPPVSHASSISLKNGEQKICDDIPACTISGHPFSSEQNLSVSPVIEETQREREREIFRKNLYQNPATGTQDTGNPGNIEKPTNSNSYESNFLDEKLNTLDIGNEEPTDSRFVVGRSGVSSNPAGNSGSTALHTTPDLTRGTQNKNGELPVEKGGQPVMEETEGTTSEWKTPERDARSLRRVLDKQGNSENFQPNTFTDSNQFHNINLSQQPAEESQNQNSESATMQNSMLTTNETVVQQVESMNSNDCKYTASTRSPVVAQVEQNESMNPTGAKNTEMEASALLHDRQNQEILSSFRDIQNSVPEGQQPRNNAQSVAEENLSLNSENVRVEPDHDETEVKHV